MNTHRSLSVRPTTVTRFWPARPLRPATLDSLSRSTRDRMWAYPGLIDSVKRELPLKLGTHGISAGFRSGRKSLNRGNWYSRQSIFMYQRVQREDVVRIPPERLGEDIDAVARELTRTTLEGKIGADKTLTLIASNIERVGEGRIVHGDGAVYQRVRYDALVFAPTLQEIVEGTVVEILKFGAFVRFGPLDGLL